MILPVEKEFNGFVRDVSRDRIPPGKAYSLIDYLPRFGAPARKRGGWGYGSAALGASGYIGALAWAPFPGANQLVAVRENGDVYKLSSMTSADSGTAKGACTNFSGVSPCKPVFFKGTSGGPFLYIVSPNVSPNDHAFSYDGSTNVSGGSVLSIGNNVRYVEPWGAFLIVAGTSTVANKYDRLKWSSDSQAAISGSTMDFPFSIVAVVGMPSQILVIGDEDTWSIYGDNPPPGGDMQRRKLFVGVGCMDARTVSRWGRNALWANSTGVYMTDGANLTDLTFAGGISQFWKDSVASFDRSSSWIATGEVFGNLYVLTVLNGSGTEVLSLLCDLQRQEWYQATNLTASMYAFRPGSAALTQELFFGLRDERRVAKAASLWTPATEDADGTDILPVWESRYYDLKLEQAKRVREAHFKYDLRSSGGSPTFSVGFITSPEETSYTTSSKTLAKTTAMKRAPVDIRRKVLGVALKLTQTAVSDDTKLYGVELEGHGLSRTRST